MSIIFEAIGGWELHILKILWELYCHIIFCLVKGKVQFTRDYTG